MKSSIHKVQVSILDALRHAETSRFSTLMQPTSLQSDTFKFHIRALVHDGFIRKTAAGEYELTPSGKELANNLNEKTGSRRIQPKLSVLVIASRQESGQTQPQYLMQQRLRNPYFGFWSCIGGPVRWGEAAEDTAARELKKQTNLTANFTVRTFYRKRDFTPTKDLLEDKLFIVIEATDIRGELRNEWPGGRNEWMTITDFKNQPKHFPSVYEAIEAAQRHQTYTAQDAIYNPQDY